ncbi:ATP-binding protein [Cesiribacter sp. SM1]|uniref:ATP-binding protein n=1 Tax=Cesiribacter sp. SM1 TaxID=2861196 RepID=UPI001CD3F9D5|nr:ATP-binding protein [Cesiribacter sp. SM1]
MQQHYNQKFDLTNCDKEPIHLIGKIQPHGLLFILNKKTLHIEQASGNTGDFLDVAPTEVIGKPLETLISPHESTVLMQQLLASDITKVQLIRLRGKQFLGFVHESSGKIILEGEPYEPITADEALRNFKILGEQQSAINQLDTVESITGSITKAVQSITDYDRVLVFQFDQDWNAAVVAETRKPGIHSFAGHHFPATDIPKPARDLLRIKPVRHIPDVLAPAVNILYPTSTPDALPVDLMQSEFRYPSEIHLEYLRNINAFGSLSISIILEGKLWGLISCSNEQAKFINYWKRELCDQLARACANKLISSHEKRNYQRFSEFKHIESKLVEQVACSDDIIKGLFRHPLNLLDITGATGAAMLLDNRIETLGVTPAETQIKELVEWLSKKGSDTVFYTRELSRDYDAAASYTDTASGLLALEVSRYNREYLLYFKAEIREKRIWAGNPEKFFSDDLRIHPRKSFEQWEEVIKGKSLPWSVNDVEIAQLLLKDIIAIRLRNQALRLEELSEEYQASSEGYKMKNKQLEDFAHIITHNLRSPLSNIQALYSIYKSTPNDADIPFFLEKIKVASDNMMATIDDLYVILKTRVGYQVRHEVVNVEELVDKEIQNLSAAIIQSGAKLTLDLGVKRLRSFKLYLESIIHNLLSNALKYSAPERAPHVKITTWRDKDSVYLSVSDNGIGIDLKKYGSKLFGLYKTFHPNYNSRGLGLYLTKMQVESLGGSITVESTAGSGTTFTVALGTSEATSVSSSKNR